MTGAEWARQEYLDMLGASAQSQNTEQANEFEEAR